MGPRDGHRIIYDAGLASTVVATIFFFNLLWDLWWPVILVAVGVGIVVGNLLGALTRTRGDAGLG